jgi:diacylglycerol kinase (ATP)
MQVTLIHNADAGEGKPSADDLQEILDGLGFQVRYASSKNNWKKALDKPADLIVAAGGDGTVAKVMRALAGRETPLALLPLGTANNIARTLRVLGDARALASAWRMAAVEPFDVGRATLNGEELLFVESVGGGIFAESIMRGREVSQPTSIVGPPSDRAMLLLREIVSAARPQPWQITLDGEDLSGEYLAVEAMNIRFCGPNVPIAPDADPGAGLLARVLVAEKQRQSLIDHLSGRLETAAATPPELLVARGRNIRLRAAGQLSAMHSDDDLLELDDRGLEISLRQGAVSLVGVDAHVAREP